MAEAARRLRISGGELSKRVADLEHRIKHQLVDRSTGHPLLNDRGLAFYAAASDITQRLDVMERELDALSNMKRVTIAADLRLFATEAAQQAYELGELGGYEVTLIDGNNKTVIDKLADGSAHMAFLCLQKPLPNITCTELVREELVILSPSTHPLARHNTVTFSQLGNHELIGHPDLGLPKPGKTDDYQFAVVTENFYMAAELTATLSFPTVVPESVALATGREPLTKVVRLREVVTVGRYKVDLMRKTKSIVIEDEAEMTGSR